MPKLCNIHIEERERTLKELKIFVDKLKKRFSTKEVYLYGSFAKDEVHEGSDIDLIIVGDFKGRIFARIDAVLKLTDLPIEPLVYTPVEFERMKRSGNPFIKGAIATGKRL